MNPLLSEDALVALMEKSGTDIIVALGPNSQADIWEKACAVKKRLVKKPKLISVGIKGSEGELLDELMELVSGDGLPESWLPEPSDIAAYFHTGGTTGAPKLAMQTHRNQLCTVELYRKSMRVGPGDVCINGLPMFHVAGALVLALGGVGEGVETVLPTMAGFRNLGVITNYWRMVEKYRVTIGGGIPTSVAAMVATPIAGVDIRSLRYMVSGGAPTPISVAKDVRKTVGCFLYPIYGMTETAGAIAMPNLDDDPPLGSAGYLSDSVQVCVDSPDNTSVSIGEICVKGPMVFPCYLGEEGSPLDSGWLRTGGLGYVDDNNNLFITGRVKDLIIRSGHNIDPVIIESCLEGHPAVAMAAAVGRPDNYAGELPVVFVQLNAGSIITEEDLLTYTLKHIDERPACPKSVIIVRALPVTAVGKIHKPTLRAETIERLIKEELKDCNVKVETLVLEKGGIRTSITLLFGDKSIAENICQKLVENLSLNIVFKALHNI